MGPRRMDGFGGPARPQRPAGAPPAGAPMQRPAQQRPLEPMARPAQPAPTRLQQPQPLRQPQPVRQQRPIDTRPVRDDQQDQAALAKKGSKWMVVLQFVIGLLVIAGVAAAIVYLYIKYYQQ